jgi:hypothetical protein
MNLNYLMNQMYDLILMYHPHPNYLEFLMNLMILKF